MPPMLLRLTELLQRDSARHTTAGNRLECNHDQLEGRERNAKARLDLHRRCRARRRGDGGCARRRHEIGQGGQRDVHRDQRERRQDQHLHRSERHLRHDAGHATPASTSSASDPSLNGPISLDTDSLVNTTTGVGTVSGTAPHRPRPTGTPTPRSTASPRTATLAGPRGRAGREQPQPADREHLGRVHDGRRVHERHDRRRHARRRTPSSSRPAAASRPRRRSRTRSTCTARSRPSPATTITRRGRHLHDPDEPAGAGRGAPARNRQPGRDDVHRLGRHEHAHEDLGRRQHGDDNGQAREATLAQSSARDPEREKRPARGAFFLLSVELSALAPEERLHPRHRRSRSSASCCSRGP